MNLSACRARRGISSLIRTPGTLVSTGRKVPRISAGASGFRSHISRCDGPPERNKTITDRARCRLRAGPCRLLQSQQVGEGQCAQAEAADAEQFTAGESVAVAGAVRRVELKHRNYSSKSLTTPPQGISAYGRCWRSRSSKSVGMPRQ